MAPLYWFASLIVSPAWIHVVHAAENILHVQHDVKYIDECRRG